MSNQNVEQPEFLADVQKLQEQITSLKKRLDLVEENREKVRQKIYEKVKSDYEKKLDGLFGELKPFQEKIETEISGLEDQILNHQEVVENNQEELEEFQLRFFAGEFAEEEFEPKQTELSDLMDTSNESIKELEQQIKNYQKHLSFITGEPIEEDDEPVVESSGDEDDDDDDPQDEAEIVVETPSQESDAVDSPVDDDSIDLLAEELEAEEAEEADDELEEEEEEFEPENDFDDAPMMADPETGLMKDTVDSEIVPEEDLVIVGDDDIVSDESESEDYEWDCIPILDVVDGDFTGESYTIDKERITMGRGPNNDIQLATDTSVSRHHAQIALEGRKYVLVDLESSNGTSVNGMRITRAVLKPNDELMVGQSKLIIRTQD